MAGSRNIEFMSKVPIQETVEVVVSLTAQECLNNSADGKALHRRTAAPQATNSNVETFALVVAPVTSVSILPIATWLNTYTSGAVIQQHNSTIITDIFPLCMSPGCRTVRGMVKARIDPPSIYGNVWDLQWYDVECDVKSIIPGRTVKKTACFAR